MCWVFREQVKLVLCAVFIRKYKRPQDEKAGLQCHILHTSEGDWQRDGWKGYLNINTDQKWNYLLAEKESAPYLTSGLISGRVAGIRHSQRNLRTWLKLSMILRDSGQLQGALHSSKANFKLLRLRFISQLYWTIQNLPHLPSPLFLHLLFLLLKFS